MSIPAFSRSFFTWALATAERTSFASGRAKRFVESESRDSASSTPFPLIWSATSRAFCALTR